MLIYLVLNHYTSLHKYLIWLPCTYLFFISNECSWCHISIIIMWFIFEEFGRYFSHEWCIFVAYVILAFFSCAFHSCKCGPGPKKSQDWFAGPGRNCPPHGLYLKLRTYLYFFYFEISISYSVSMTVYFCTDFIYCNVFAYHVVIISLSWLLSVC